jgi:conjugal transfer pilus assembly protein TraK
MVNRLVCLSLLCLSTNLCAQSLPFRDNSDVNLVISDKNYNRLVVRGDKITQAHFPEGALAFEFKKNKADEDNEQDGEPDGSMYVMAANPEPFTLFITTQSGHHFSATVSSESGLGKTIEFIPQMPASTLPVRRDVTAQRQAVLPFSDAIRTLMTSMMSEKTPTGFEVKHHYGRVVRLQQGLMLTPKLTYNGLQFNGEVMALYNGSNEPRDIQESWFAEGDVKAVSLSKTTLAPKQTALVYRVLERAHG